LDAMVWVISNTNVPYSERLGRSRERVGVLLRIALQTRPLARKMQGGSYRRKTEVLLRLLFPMRTEEDLDEMWFDLGGPAWAQGEAIAEAPLTKHLMTADWAEMAEAHAGEKFKSASAFFHWIVFCSAALADHSDSAIDFLSATLLAGGSHYASMCCLRSMDMR